MCLMAPWLSIAVDLLRFGDVHVGLGFRALRVPWGEVSDAMVSSSGYRV